MTNYPVAQPLAVPLLFKVLVAGKSCHGGTAEWPPLGEWTPDVMPACCSSGWHLTSDPLRWWKPEATLWLCESRGQIDGDNSDKAAFASVRRLLEVTGGWTYLPMFPRVCCFLAASMRSHDSNADIAWAKLSGSNLSRSNLCGSKLYGSNLSGSDLSRSNLSRSNLSGSNLSGSNLSGSDLCGSNLSGSNLSGSNLSGSDLYGSNLSGSDLSRSNLSRSNLCGSNLCGSDLCGSTLSGSNLYGSKLYVSDPVPTGWTRNAENRLEKAKG